MKYTLTTYKDGAKDCSFNMPNVFTAVRRGAEFLENTVLDEFEVTNEYGHVVAYAMTEDNPKAASEKAISRKEMQGDHMREIAAEIQREELASREAQRGARYGREQQLTAQALITSGEQAQ